MTEVFERVDFHISILPLQNLVLSPSSSQGQIVHGGQTMVTLKHLLLKGTQASGDHGYTLQVIFFILNWLNLVFSVEIGSTLGVGGLSSHNLIYQCITT